jgi:ATP-dependent helicase/nuclease subunit A
LCSSAPPPSLLEDIRVETANHGMEIPSATHLWDTLTSTAPPIGALVASLTEEQRTAVQQALDGTLRQRAGGGPAVRAFAVDDGGAGERKARCQRVEAAHLARKLRQMLDDGVPVHDPQSGDERPVRPGDIALLSRVWQPLGLYGEALAAEGIPAVHSGGGNLLETRETRDGLALLGFLADTSDDISLAAVLRGPFFAVEDAALQRLAERKTRGQPWWELLEESDDPHVAVAREALGELLEQRQVEPPSVLLEIADSLTGYTAVIENLPGGERRAADWRGFRELVHGLEGGAADVFSVARSLRRISDSGAAPPRPALEAGDAVTLTTIHSGKGLEWPVVVIPDLARTGPNRPPRVLFEPDLGTALDVSGESEAEPVLYRVILERRKRREAAEARRVFYVAPTRARDHLILSAAEGLSNRQCGLTLLAPGLDAAGAILSPVVFEEEDARPPELPLSEPAEPPELLLGQA